ncbi:hypothetical protein, partial [Proteus mirabilis]|uniref:hypothetical protein n=1 Tax=Proteus mirabilis TaxID=584 RepID=UPI001952EA0C
QAARGHRFHEGGHAPPEQVGRQAGEDAGPGDETRRQEALVTVAAGSVVADGVVDQTRGAAVEKCDEGCINTQDWHAQRVETVVDPSAPLENDFERRL